MRRTNIREQRAIALEEARVRRSNIRQQRIQALRDSRLVRDALRVQANSVRNTIRQQLFPIY